MIILLAMDIHQIEKQALLSEPFSPDALKLARALYHTYINNDEETSMEIKLHTIISLLGLQSSKKAIEYIKELLDELNEPLAVKNFKFYSDIYELRFITFCKYTLLEETLEIELSEEYLLAESHYIVDSFLSN